MGLAASQGRYLCLTARMSDLIYEGQQISQQRLQLAMQTQEISTAYTEAMNNTIMQVTTAEGGTQQLTYDIITSQDPFSGLCMRIVDENGNVVVPKPSYTLNSSYTDDDGNLIEQSYTSSLEFIKDFLPELNGDEINKMAVWDLNELLNYYKIKHPDSTVNMEVTSNVNQSLKSSEERFLYDENCKDPEYLQKMLQSGQWTLEQARPQEDEWESVTWQASSAISEIYYTADDAAAEAEYDAQLQEIQKRDKILELRLEQVQTEEKAIETELSSVKDVISKNIEDTFKTFA